jgi:hypothetical protein
MSSNITCGETYFWAKKKRYVIACETTSGRYCLVRIGNDKYPVEAAWLVSKAEHGAKVVLKREPYHRYADAVRGIVNACDGDPVALSMKLPALISNTWTTWRKWLGELGCRYNVKLKRWEVIEKTDATA